MPRTWATWGGDLHLEVGGRVRSSLERGLREAIRDGRLRPGTRLPSSRALAADLGIARNSAADAYAQLIAEGWLASRQGAGTWVAEHRVSPPAEPAADQLPMAMPRYDLRPGVPDLSMFPRTAWVAALRRALAAAPLDVMGYTDPRGLQQLRSALSDYLSRARGVAIAPERIVICSGFADGLGLVCEVLRRRGAKSLAVEAYGHALHRNIAEAARLRVHTTPVDAGGAVIDASEPAGALLVTPAHQFPLGVALHPERRRRAIEWAVSSNAVIIEDDYDGEFRYDRQAVGAMQALAPDHIVYAGTVSKTLAPGLRLAWLVLPNGLVDDVIAVKTAVHHLSSSLDQLALAEFITSGAYDRHVRRTRLAYRRRRDRLVAALHRHAPAYRITGIAAGLHALIQLPPGESEGALVARALSRRLAVQGLNSFRLGAQECAPALVVGYARPPEHAFTAALARLTALLTER